MNKSDVKAKMVAAQKSLIEDINALITSLDTTANLDEETTLDLEDFSQQEEANTLKQIHMNHLSAAQVDLSFLEKINVQPTDTVGIGALVETENASYYISISTPLFHENGKNLMGLSIQSPLFNRMKGKKAGDSFEFANHTYHILSIQ